MIVLLSAQTKNIKIGLFFKNRKYWVNLRFMLKKLPTVAIVLYPGFSPFHFSIPHIVFSIELEGKPLFHLKFIAEDQQVSDESHTIMVQAVADLEYLQLADIIVISGWNDLATAPSQHLQRALKQAYHRGASIVGLCYGAYPLAYTGILNGKKATTHWLAEEDFKNRFPHVQLDINSIYIEDERVITSAGTAAGLDCCLAIVRQYYGVKIANKLARLLVIPPHREGGQAQFIEQPIARKTARENINQMLLSIRENLAHHYTLDGLASRLMMSRSTFTRHFKKATGMSFNQWLIDTRLQQSRDLLESTHLSIEEIAAKVGFHSATAFRQHFKHKHHISPKQWRKQFTID